MIARQIATESGFVSVPTGSSFGKPTFMTGWFTGEFNGNGSALVEFIIENDDNEYPTVKVGVSPYSMYVATDHEIAEAAEGRNGLAERVTESK